MSKSRPSIPVYPQSNELLLVTGQTHYVVLVWFYHALQLQVAESYRDLWSWSHNNSIQFGNFCPNPRR